MVRHGARPSMWRAPARSQVCACPRCAARRGRPVGMMVRRRACHSRVMHQRRTPGHVLLRMTVVLIASAVALLLAGAVLASVDRRGLRARARSPPPRSASSTRSSGRSPSGSLLPITVLTLGLGALVLNGAVVLLVAGLEPGLQVDTLAAAIAVAFLLTVVNTVGDLAARDRRRRLLYRNVVKRRARRDRRRRSRPTCPGCCSSRSTGWRTTCCCARCATATRRRMARWLRDGSHRLARWETDWSSQTGACQAGLLHGDNDDMPAFRWWEKDRGAAIVTNHPKDAAELERRHSDGRGLLFADGASRANILSGDAPHSLLTMSTVARPRPAGPDRPGLLRLLRQPLQRHAHAGARRSARSSASCGARPSSAASTCARACTAASPTR